MRVNKMDCTHNFRRTPGGLMQIRNILIHYVRCESCGLIKREDKLSRFFEHPNMNY
jgi:hypothetical protein